MHVTFGEEGSCWAFSPAVGFFLRKNRGLAFAFALALAFDFPRPLLLPTLLLKNLINGGGNFSTKALPGLEIGFEDEDGFILYSIFSLLLVGFSPSAVLSVWVL